MRINIKNNKVAMILTAVILSVVVFITSYTLSYIYNKNKADDLVAASSNNIEKESEMLEDDYKVVLTRRLFNDTIAVDSEVLIKDLKEEIGVQELTEESLAQELEKKGYKQVSNNDSSVVFERENGILDPNKYYIGETDGFVSIIKSDNNGKATTELPEDISSVKVDDLPQTDRHLIRNMEQKYDTREDCEEALSSYTS